MRQRGRWAGHRTGRAASAPSRHGARTLSIHARLTIGFGAALAVCGALMVATIYVGMRWLPTYDFTTPVVVPPGSNAAPAKPVAPVDRDTPSPPAGQGSTASPSPGGLVHLPDSSGIRTKEDVWSTVLAVSIGGVLVVATGGLLLGRRLSRRLLAPLEDLNHAATRAADGDLSHRINATGPHDELRRLADTFDVTLSRLENSLASHRRFAANAAHELLTPLSTTKTALQMLGDRPSPEELAEVAPMLTESNERNIRVVRELLRLAETEHITFDSDPVDMAALAEETVAALHAAPPGGPALTLVADDPDCAVRGSTTLLRRLIVNLTENGLKHNTREPDAYVTVTVAPTTCDRDGQHADRVLLEVANSGPRVDPATVEKLFEPFYRAHTRVESARGYGLGLALVQAIAEAHGGTVEARANATGGLTVRVSLPALTEPA
ncbi:HAMP domain-containing sensor histidine kinase [Streptomyces sp. NPDC001941]|uniref:HAMP domain-containing sensor histidine kinase n=1 Tax=Streptomyces sp. NPDC001941 TaxID=3154659 RepID=UPI00331EB1A2